LLRPQEQVELRILYHHRTQGRGAEGNHIVSIVSALRECGHHVDVMSPPGVDPFDPAASIPADESKSRWLSWASLWKTLSLRLPNWLFEIAELGYNLPAYFRLRRRLRAGGYELLYERYATYMVAGALAARARGCRYLVEFNDVSGVADRVRPQTFQRFCAWVERALVSRCDLGHAVSSYLGQRLVAIGLPESRLIVAPNGFDAARMKLTVGREQIRRRLGVQDSLVFGFAGWFVPWDRLDFLADVFSECLSHYPDARLCLVGDGEPARALLAATSGTPLGNAIVLTGAVARAEVYDYIQSFDIGILPHSNLFGSPMVMFEMMALEVPIVAPALPPILDVHKDGESALLFRPLDKTECIARMLELAGSSQLRRTLAERARSKLLSEHSWERTAGRILAALDRVEEHRT
jgi:glycosyltransferase involved in cell wall biosynthesis